MLIHMKSIISFCSSSFTRRLYVAGFLFLLPLLFVSVILFNSQSKEIENAKLELAGYKIATLGVELQSKATLEVSRVARGGENQKSYMHAIEGLRAFLKDKDVLPKTKSSLAAIDVAIKAFENEKGYNREVFDSLEKSCHDFLKQLASEYGLSTDSDLLSYNLINFSILQSSNVLENLRKFADSKYVEDLWDGSGHTFALYVKQGQFEEAVGNYYDAGYGVIGAMSDPVNNEKFAALITSSRKAVDLFERSQENIENIDYLAFNAVSEALDYGMVILGSRLNHRLNQLLSTQLLVNIFAFSLFFTAFSVVFASLSNGIVNPLKRTISSMQKIVDGEFDQQFGGNSRKDEIGAIMRALKVLRDNSVARIEAEKATKAKSEFLAVMSHEIRTPMNGVLGMAQALKGTELKQDQTKMLDILIESGNSMVSLLNDILDMSKIESGKIDFEEIAMSPCSIVNATAKLYESKTLDDVKLSFEIEDEANGWYRGDPTRIAQILRNLVSNAVKFTQKGEINITLSANENRLRFAVKDTGIGIPEDKIATLFGKFTQMDSSHSRVYGGTGLGLSICEGLVTALGGSISATSTIGVGSEFVFEIPAQKVPNPKGIDCSNCKNGSNPDCLKLPQTEKADAIQEIENFTVANDEDQEMHILVAEDVEINRLVIRTLFDQIGLKVDFAENGRIAYDMWVNNHYDVIIMDVQMPIWDGLKATRAIRSFERKFRRPRTPIVSLSANAMEHHIEEHLAAGMDSHAAKPINFEKLLSSIDSAIAICEEKNAEDAARKSKIA